MLCPKCGFISFDHLLVCVKCKQDLSQIGADLHGTATEAECRHFLGLVLKVAATPVESSPQRAEVPEAEAVVFEQNNDDEAAGLIEDKPNDDFGEKEAVFTADESPALEFEFEEIPQLDISDFEPAATDEKISPEPEGTELEEAVSLDLYLEEAADQRDATSLQAAGPPLADQPEIDSSSFEIDPASLTLTSAQDQLEGWVDQDEDTTQLRAQLPSEDKAPAQLTIDLNEIDLSDLVHESSDNLPESDQAMAPLANEGLDYEDTMDLSLFIGEDHDTPVVVPAPLTDYTGVEPIDLTLMDEALAEFTVDHGRQEQVFQPESPSPELALSMEDKPK